MGVEIARKKNGSLRSKWWYGHFTVNGKDTTINLGVEIKGSASASLRKMGDKAFEHSRLKAQVKLDGGQRQLHLPANEQIPLAEIESCWLNLPSHKRRTELPAAPVGSPARVVGLTPNLRVVGYIS